MKPTNFPTRQKAKRLVALNNLKAKVNPKGDKKQQERIAKEIAILEERTR